MLTMLGKNKTLALEDWLSGSREGTSGLTREMMIKGQTYCSRMKTGFDRRGPLCCAPPFTAEHAGEGVRELPGLS